MNADVLDWEELEGAPNTLGAFSFLRPQCSVIDIQHHRPRETEESTQVAVRADKTSTVDVMFATAQKLVNSDNSASTNDKTSTVDVLSSTISAKRRERPYKVHRCRLAQDGHSAGEEILYRVLWGGGDPIDNETRQITMGFKRLGGTRIRDRIKMAYFGRSTD